MPMNIAIAVVIERNEMKMKNGNIYLLQRALTGIVAHTMKYALYKKLN